MPARRARAALVAVVASGVLASALAPGAGAAAPVTLDGAKRHKATYDATVDEVVVGSTTELASARVMEPSREDCTSGSCDVTRVHLTLPRGSTVGRFAVTVDVPRELYATAKLYDVRGKELYDVDATTSDELPFQCCGTETGYRMSFEIARLRAGDYTFVVFDRGGSGSFTVTLDYTARRPERRTRRS